jgi:hypothetical protein
MQVKYSREIDIKRVAPIAQRMESVLLVGGKGATTSRGAYFLGLL